MFHKEIFTHSTNTYWYWTKGDRKNPIMVILPGFTGTHKDLLTFANEFSDYLVVIPDFPGWGDSSKKGYPLTIHGYATFLHDLLATVPSKEKILLMGHCMGSVVAIEFTYTFPEKVQELFLIGVPYIKGNLADRVFHALSHTAPTFPKLLRPFLYFFRSRIIAIPLGFFIVQSKSLTKKIKIIFANAVKQQFQAEDVVEKNWDSLSLYQYEKIKKISLPIHFFHGAKDMLVKYSQAEKLAALCQHATFDVLPNAGHMPPVETPIALANNVKKYLILVKL